MKYRREIDGLRAVAVVPVIFYHAGFDWVPGGFYGVDLFFVISGYLITSLILEERAQGHFKLREFYERRMRRIFPALFVMLACCIPAAVLWLLPDDLKEFSRSLIAVCLFVSNLFFYRQSGYFDTTIGYKPLVHTWSLGIEEQYYLFFPLLLAGLACWGWRVLGLGLAMLLVLSLGWALWLTPRDPIASFYFMPTRGWELMLGSLSGLYLHRRGYPKARLWVSQLITLAGGVAILWAFIQLDHLTPDPGWASLLPTLAAVALIMFAGRGDWVGTLLQSRPLVGVGLISYSAYLWHQPLLAFARNASLREPSRLEYLGLALAALGVGFLSWKLVELPVRTRGRISLRTLTRYSAGAVGVFMVLGAIGQDQKGFPQRFALAAPIRQQLVGRMAVDECGRNGGCLLGDRNAGPAHIAVFGDSHAAALLPAFDQLGQQLHRPIRYFGTGGCPPIQGVVLLSGNEDPHDCQALLATQLRYLQNNPGLVHELYLVARWSAYTDGDYAGKGVSYLGSSSDDPHTLAHSRLVFETGLEETLRAYTALGIRVVLVDQVPQHPFNPKDIYYREGQKEQSFAQFTQALNTRFSLPLAQHLKLQAYDRGLFRRLAMNMPGVRELELDQAFCNSLSCRFGSAQLPYYRDRDHLSQYGASLTESLIRPTLTPGLD